MSADKLAPIKDIDSVVAAFLRRQADPRLRSWKEELPSVDGYVSSGESRLRYYMSAGGVTLVDEPGGVRLMLSSPAREELAHLGQIEWWAPQMVYGTEPEERDGVAFPDTRAGLQALRPVEVVVLHRSNRSLEVDGVPHSFSRAHERWEDIELLAKARKKGDGWTELIGGGKERRRRQSLKEALDKKSPGLYRRLVETGNKGICLRIEPRIR
jgi:hypothetical protein